MNFMDKIKDLFQPEQNKAEYKSKFVSQETISNEDYQAIRKAEEDRLEAAYDLNSLNGINSIPISILENPINGNSTTGQLEYYLPLKANEYEQKGEYELALACLRKSNELMEANISIKTSPSSYSKDSYLKLVKLLKKLRRFDEAREEEEKINKLFGDAENDKMINHNQLNFALNQAERLGTDLVEMSAQHGCTCGECAKYQGRWFSLSGNNKKYPKMPNCFFENGGKIHEGCRHIFFPVFDGISIPTYYDGDIVKYSNRPFVDDRTPEEKAKYEEMVTNRAMQAEMDETRESDRRDYEWLWEHMEHLCPKSFGGYRRMKKSNSQNFQKLCEEALKSGKDLRS